MLFTGEYEITIRTDHRLTLPRKFYDNLYRQGGGNDLGYPVLLVPIYDCITVLSLDSLKDSGDGNWINSMNWMGELREMVRRNRIYPCNPLYKTNDISHRLQAASDLLSTEVLKSRTLPQKLSGHDFERLLYEVLLYHGINVQMNVHLVGGEIDLLLSEVNDNGTVEFTVIECKNWELSQGKVGINQVMRMFGLNAALKTNMCMKNAMIVSTTGFTRNARQFAKVYQMNLLDYSGFWKWIEAHGLVGESLSCPLFEVAKLDRQKRIRLPGSLASYAGMIGRDVCLVGVGDRVEIWDSGKWKHQSDLDAAFLDNALQTLGYRI